MECLDGERRKARVRGGERECRLCAVSCSGHHQLELAITNCGCPSRPVALDRFLPPDVHVPGAPFVKPTLSCSMSTVAHHNTISPPADHLGASSAPAPRPSSSHRPSPAAADYGSASRDSAHHTIPALSLLDSMNRSPASVKQQVRRLARYAVEESGESGMSFYAVFGRVLDVRHELRG